MHLAFVTEMATSTALAFDVHGLGAHDHVIWLVGGVTPMLIYTKLGRPPVVWVFPVQPLPFPVRAGSRFLAALGRMCGTPLPVPAFHDLADPGGLAEHLSALLTSGRRLCVTGYASSAVRIAAAARERGTSLSGVCFITLGEPFTEGKRRIVEDSGARALVRYAFTEGGILGYACGTPAESDDLHFFTDCYGLVQRHRPVGSTELEVDAFLVTSLLPPAPKILLNVETGDYGRIENRPCGCALGAAGLTTHVSRIRSFEKLSGEGMTFVQTDLLRVLEQVLPARFGGTGADYQVVEEEQNGILKLFLTISPRVGTVDERAARDAFLKELGREGGFEQVGVEFWRRAETVSVRREWPKATKAGKILPFQIEKSQAP
jgi:phenylacetate-coenzyme A ligase PaaK-like adenylate-forming protein